MNLSYLLMAAVAGLTAASANAADYLFTLTGSSSASFVLPASPTPDFVVDGVSFFVDNVNGTVNGNAGTLFLNFSNTVDSGGFSILSSFISTTGEQLYTGTEAAPTFKIGTFALSEFGGSGRYSLAIAAVAGAVPEPASWALMLGGFGIMGASLRYRRQSVAATTA